MEYYISRMDTFQTASRVCFGIAVAAFLIAVILFFLFDIRTIFMIKTGRAQQKTVQEMHDRNLRTGKLRDDSGSIAERRTKKGNTGAKTKAQTMKIGAETVASPASHSHEPGINANVRNNEAVNQETALLQGNQPQRGNENVAEIHFKIVQKTIITHTDENIAV